MARLLIDANIPNYVWGREHPLKEPSVQVFHLAVDYPSAFFTDAEVLQELLHRHKSLRTFNAVRADFNEFVRMMHGRIEPMLAEDVRHAAELVERYPRLSARDLIHVAIAIRADATHIVSADAAFDGLREIERLDPMRVDEWRELVVAA